MPTHPADAQVQYTIVESAAARGLAGKQETWSATTMDYNADGIEDVWIGYHDQGGKLYRGLGGGQFASDAVTAPAWPRRQQPTPEYPDPAVIDRHDCAFGHFTRQSGRLDAYCVTGRTKADVVKTGDRDNELWKQQADGSFIDVGTSQGVGDPYGRGQAALVLDANDDGWDDIYVLNTLPRSGTPDSRSSNKLFLNLAGTGFAPAPSSASMSTSGTAGVTPRSM